LWGAGYILEWVLSFDNLFAFYLVFKAFKVPDGQVHQTLAVGVYGAAILRVVFFLFMREALDTSLWIDEAVGAMLIVSGVGAIIEADAEDADEQPDPPWVARCFKWIFGTRLMETYDDAGRMFTHDGTRWRVTMLMLTACVIMIVDVIFALDSVGAKSHEFTSVYLNLSSSIMAMFTLRQAYFIISALADTFEYFKFGVAAVLAIIGLDLVMSPWGGMDERYLSVLISSAFAISIMSSVARQRADSDKIRSTGKN
jgi:tellurite resistance protein TerC